MDFLASNLLVPTNSRRRTKGRLPFVDSAEPVFPNEDEKLENDVNIPENELEYDFSGNLDDVDEEQVTIDLSEFLNENPLLTEPSENLTDSGATLTDCHSQFRVTSSLADPTPVPIDDVPSQKDLNVNEPTIVTEKCLDISETDNNTPVLPVSEMPPNVLSENNISIDSTKIPTDVVSNISPHKENILIGVKSSPIKNHKAKSAKSANLFQKYKNISKLKDFNKNNMKVFGKYPIVKCERLDIENFIKTNNIKVRNWPIISTNNHFKTKANLNKNVARKCKTSNKVPKLLNKPISFNRSDSNSQNLATVNKARSILIDALATNSSPLIIKTDSWKPEIANLTGGSATFVKPENFQLPVSQGLPKPLGSQRIIKIVHASSPLQMNKFCAQSQKLPILTNVNKVTVGSKTFQLVSPNTFVATKPEKSKPVTPILPKPNTEAISPVILKDYTVIQPYVEDPTSPVKPKPLLTVPLDIVPVANAFNPPELYSTATEIHSPIKPPLKSVKPVQSVFLNGAINQISSPITVEKESLTLNVTDSVRGNEETTFSNNVNKTNDQLNTDMSIISSKSTMIDVITSVFSKSQVRKQPKSKQNHLRSHRGGDSAIVECKAYNTTLNDMLFNDDFTDENYSLDDSIDISSDTCLPDASNTILQSPQTYQSDQNFVQGNSTVSSSDDEKCKNKLSRQKHSRKKVITPHDSDTLSASEGEEENNPKQKRLFYTKRKHRKLNAKTLYNHKNPTDSSETASVFNERTNISSEKSVTDIPTNKNATNSDKRNRVCKKTEADIHFENSSESLKLSEEKGLSTNKQSFSKTSKIETSSLSNATSQNDEGKSNDSTKDDTQEKVKTAQESKIGVLNLRNRHKSTSKSQTAVALVKSKRIGCVRAKFKVKSKKPSNNKVMCNNTQSSRSADIIEEIKTITGGNIFNKKLQKKENSLSEKVNHSSSSKNVCTRSKNETKAKTVSKAPKQTRRSLPVRSKTKKRIKTLKVLFKRPAPKQKSKSLEVPFDNINFTLLDNETDPNSVSENNTNLHSTFRNSKSHKMDTPGKEEQKCDADVLPTELKSDDSLKENILKENEIFANGIDTSTVENSVGTESEESLHGENNISISEEIKSCSISGQIETMEDIPENETSNTINSSCDKQQTDAPVTENLSSSCILKETNSDVSNDSNLVIPSTENLLNNVSEDADFNLKEKFQTENSVSVHELCEDDITNENKNFSDEEILEHNKDVDTTNVLKEGTVSACADIQEFGFKSNSNTLSQDHKPENNSDCDNSCNITSVSDEIQKHISNNDSNIIIEKSHEIVQTCHQVPENDLNNEVESNKVEVATENLKMNEHNCDDVMLEDSDIGKDLGNASVSKEIHDNDHTQEINEDNDVTPCDDNPDDNVIVENSCEIKVTSKEIPNHDPISNSASYKISNIFEKMPKDNHNSDDNNIQNALFDSKIDGTSSQIKDNSFSEIEKIPEKKRGRKPKRKSCPKIKLSIAKKTDDLESAGSSKNWYISERKESTDSTQSEEQPKNYEIDSSKRGRKTAAKSSFPLKITDKNERICFETVAEIHAVDTDINPSCSRVSTEISAISDEISNLVNNDSSTVSSKENKTSSEGPTADLSSNTSTRLSKFVPKRKLTCIKSSNLAKIKEEHADIGGNSTSETAANIKLDNEEITKAMDEITVETSHSSSRRKGQTSSTVTKKIRIDTVAARALVKNQIQKKVIKKPSSKGITDSPSGQSAKLPDNTGRGTPTSAKLSDNTGRGTPTSAKLPDNTGRGTPTSAKLPDNTGRGTPTSAKLPDNTGRGTPTSLPKSRKKSYSPEAVIVPFSLGWMRELVHRSTEDKTGKRMSDVYYFSPEGTKLRSMIEISNYLSRHPECNLTIQNFTFWKDLVYREPFEIERSAKQKSVFGTSSETSHQTSIKKYIKSTALNNSSLNSNKGKSQKTNISVENKYTPAFSKEKHKTKILSNSDGKANTFESENKNAPASSKGKQKAKILSNSDGKVDTVESEKNKNTPASSKEKQKTKILSNSDGKVDIESEKSSELPLKSPVAPNAKKKAEKTENVSNSIMDTVENSDNTSSRSSRRIVKKVPFDNSESDNSQPRAKRGRPSKSLNTSVPELEITKTVNDAESSIINTHSDSSKQTEARNLAILAKNDSKSTATKGRRPKLKVIFSKNNDSGIIQPPCSARCLFSVSQRPTVQCAICLCLFHSNCIPKLSEKVIFACKSCTMQKLALYEKERKSFSVSETSLLPDDFFNFDPDIDMSLLSPEVILNEQTGSVILPSTSESDVLPKNSGSNIPQGPSGTILSDTVKNVHQGNHITSSPHLLSHLLQPTALLNSSALTVGSKPTNQNLNSSSSHMLLTKETASRLFQFGTLAPGTNISAAMPLIVKMLPDGRKVVVRSTSNLLSPLNNCNNSVMQNPNSNINANFQILSNISDHVNGSLFSSISNQTDDKATSIGNKYNIRNVKFVSTDHTFNSIRKANLLNNIKIRHELNSKNFKSSSTSNNTSEPLLFWDMNKMMSPCNFLLQVFKRLNISDRLRAGQACLYWKHVASEKELWERVSFQGLTITNWERCCVSLKKNGTKTIDLRGIVHQNMTNPWKDLETHVVHLAGIEELLFDQITPSLLKSISLNLPLLRKLDCHFLTTACSEPEIWTVPCELQLSSLRYLGRLVKLKIGCGSRIELKNREEFVMPYLPHLRHVALTGFNFCSNVNLESLSKQKELISLELGDCKEIEPGIYSLLENLTNLRSLRLENGGNLNDYRLSETLLKIKGLEVLELMNFKISKKLSEAFRELKHLIHLNVWPDNTEEGAVVNRNLFNAISSCKDLKYLCWGIIAESECVPKFLEMENSNELTFENLFNDLVALFPECRVEVKWAARRSWREFCSTRK